MAAYIVITRESVRDQHEYDKYKIMVRPTFAGHNAQPLALGGRHEVVEGAPTDGVFLMEFPSYEEAVAWYRSSAYQAISQHRFASSDHRFIIFEGISPAPVIPEG